MRAATVLATWFGCGLAPRAPGTAGTLGALPLVAAAWWTASPGLHALLAAGVLAVGLLAARDTSAWGGRKDPPQVVIDEVAGMLVATVALPPSWVSLALAFVLFRAFDVLKPWPCRRLERLDSSWGVMADDVMAGLYANFAAQALLRVGELFA
ncbi:MAG: phosphatidylglycerophosphatase A [Acidobacteria bacterium]|nr:MAG: phosphatidylglycerophosphatase A [Acidobacteriota bacterium]